MLSRPTEQPRGREGGSRAARTPQQGGRHFWKSWLTKRSTSPGAMGGRRMALLGVPQQGGREQLCLLQLFKHSASSLSVRPARIHTFNTSFSRMWVVLIHASISTSIPLPPRLLKFPPHLHSRRKSIAEGTGIPHTEAFMWRKTMILTTRPSQDDLWNLQAMSR